MFTILTGNVDEQLLDTDAVWPCDERVVVHFWVSDINVASSRYSCDGAGLACNAQEDAEFDPPEKL